MQFNILSQSSLVSIIITRNGQDYQSSTIRIITAEEYLSSIL